MHLIAVILLKRALSPPIKTTRAIARLWPTSLRCALGRLRSVRPFNPIMRLVYYSIACVPGSSCQKQWLQSIRSLRRNNKEIAVCLFVYGTPEPYVAAEADRQNVRLFALGPYADCFSALPASQATVLPRYRTLHKLLSLRHCPSEHVEQILYVDCDTFFFGDVATLFDRYRTLHWYAREEPCSSRSRDGYDAGYVDEALLAQLARQEHAEPVLPYNSGVFLMNHGVWSELARYSHDFLRFTWRLLLGQCRAPEGIEWLDHEALALARANASEADWRGALPYPSRNAWIVEQVALWLTLGLVPSLTHDTLAPTDVAQGGECLVPHDAMLAHYYSNNEQAFFERVTPL